MHSIFRISPLLLTLAFAACGGSTPPANDANNEKKDDASGSSAKRAADSGSADEERQGFMGACMEKPEYDAYCNCTWDSITKDTTAEERTDLENANTKKALSRARGQCLGKMPKSAHKDNFVKSCASKPEMVAFCGCSYDYLDSKGLLTASSEELDKVTDDMRASCSKEWAVLTKGAFMEGCTSKQSQPVCECTFAALEKKYGKEKVGPMLQAGSPEVRETVKSASITCAKK